jgi:putative oxidoreductase
MNSTTTPIYPAGRALLGVLFLISGIFKIGGFSGVAAWMASAGMPFASVLLVLTIAVEIGGGLTLITGWNARWGALVLALFLVPVSLVFHGFWSADAANYQNQFNHFFKNIAILGGMLVVFSMESARARIKAQ